MTTVSKKFSFVSDVESWQSIAGSGVTMGYSSAVGNPSGSLQSRLVGRNQNGILSHWQWAGTWEDLGVPAGAVVTHIRLNSADYRCTEQTHDPGSRTRQSGPWELRNSGGTLLNTLRAAISWTGVHASWQNASGTDQAVGEASKDSNTSIQLRVYNTLSTGNAAAAATTVHDDEIEFTITYEEEALPASFKAQTRRAIRSSASVVAQTRRKITSKAARSAQAVRKVVKATSVSAQTSRTVKALSSFVAQTLRALTSLSEFTAQTRRNIISQVTALGQTSRTVKSLGDFKGQTYRILHSLASFSAQTRRVITEAPSELIASFKAQTVRAVEKIADFKGQTRRKLTKETSIAVQTVRNVYKITQNVVQTFRKVTDSASFKAQTLRNIVTHLVASFKAQTQRTVLVKIVQKGQTKRQLTQRVQVSVQTVRKLVNQAVFVGQTVKTVKKLIQYNSQGVRKILKTTAFIAQTVRNILGEIYILFAIVFAKERRASLSIQERVVRLEVFDIAKIGNTIRLFGEFPDWDGNLADPTGIKLTIYYANGGICEVITNGIVREETGKYYHDYLVPDIGAGREMDFEFEGVLSGSKISGRSSFVRTW